MRNDSPNPAALAGAATRTGSSALAEAAAIAHDLSFEQPTAPEPAPDDPVVQVRGLVKTYPLPEGGAFNAVNGIWLDVHAGELLAILGPNGAGKTTALEIVEGLRQPTAGEVRVLGLDVVADHEAIKRHIGVQLQASAYFPLLTLEEILELFGSWYPRRRDPLELLELVGLGEKRRSLLKHLSGGQAQRFSIAAALVNDPEILFLDEPTTGLDPQARRNVWELIRALRQDRGMTIVLTTHYMEEAEVLSDRVAIIDRGEIQALDTPAALIAGLNGSGTLEDVFLTLTGHALRED